MTTARQHLDLPSFFERLERELFVNTVTETRYPLYNLIHYPKQENDEYIYTVLELAVAGFSKEELTVTLEGNKLCIEGKKFKTSKDYADLKYIQKQITSKPFKVEFAMAKDCEIDSVSLTNGILSISVKKAVPENLKPKKIEIK